MGELVCWDPPYLLNHTSPSAGRTMVPSQMETQQERGPPSSFPTMWGSAPHPAKQDMQPVCPQGLRCSTTLGSRRSRVQACPQGG